MKKLINFGFKNKKVLIEFYEVCVIKAHIILIINLCATYWQQKYG